MKILETFESDKNKLKTFTKKLNLKDEFLYFDFSKTHLDREILNDYYNLIEKKNIYGKINDMFSGEKINYTEKRSVLHVLLRDKNILKSIHTRKPEHLDKVKKSIYDELIKMMDFSQKLHTCQLKGCTGKSINTIVNIGIGGSDLGPKMVCDALKHYAVKNINVKFISNIDATASFDVLDKIDVEKTLFVVVSKTFTTLETIKNMELAANYLKKKLDVEMSVIYKCHFVAVSSNTEEVEKYNINNTFLMWDFVGGRYSLWSTVGLSIVLYIGFDNFLVLLSGASLIDEQFKQTKREENLEIFHALVEIYYSENCYNNKCIVSYDQHMQKMYLYLQQAEMESNGKYSESTDTGMIIWGGIGTDTQHSFFQLLHQGTRKILTEFLFPVKPLHKEQQYHDMLLSNCFAQSMALMKGKEGTKGIDYFEGDKPSISIGYSKLTPLSLGALIAHYEHKIFVQGIYWEINSFDQYGVTLGKKIATDLLQNISNGKEGNYDDSTNELLSVVKHKK